MIHSMFIFIWLLFFQINLIAQGWEPEIHLVSTGFNAFNPDIEASQNNIYVTWDDYREGPNSHIYFKRSADQGLNWFPGERLSIDPAQAYNSAVSAKDNMVYVVWCDTRDHGAIGEEIYYRRSTNNGEWFEASTRLTNFVSGKWEPQISIFENNIHVVWFDERTNADIYYIHSTDYGLNWSPELLLTQPVDLDIEPRIAVSGTNIFLLWTSERSGVTEVYFRRSTDNGLNWEPEQKISFSTDPNLYHISMAAFNENIHVIWLDWRTGASEEIFYRRSLNSGVDWSPETRLTFNPGGKEYTSMSCFENNVHIAWTDYRHPDQEIHYIKSVDNGENWEVDMLLSSIPDVSEGSSIATFSNNAYVVWEDRLAGVPSEIIFKRFISPTSVEDRADLPGKYFVYQNYPNPFNPGTKIKYEIIQRGLVEIRIYDFLGRQIDLLLDEEQDAGSYEVRFDASNLPSGIYFYQLQTPNFTQIKKMILLK